MDLRRVMRTPLLRHCRKVSLEIRKGQAGAETYLVNAVLEKSLLLRSRQVPILDVLIFEDEQNDGILGRTVGVNPIASRIELRTYG